VYEDQINNNGAGMYFLFELMSAVVDGDGVVVAVETVNQRLNRRFVQMTQVRGGLSRLLVQRDRLRVDRSERVNHNLKK
jgi:hypothetical protein